MGIFTEYERHQQKINDTQMPDCLKHMRRVTRSESNWNVYYDPIAGYCWSIAKPNSGAGDSVYGGPEHCRRLYYEGHLKWKDFTKYGRRLCGIN